MTPAQHKPLDDDDAVGLPASDGDAKEGATDGSPQNGIEGWDGQAEGPDSSDPESEKVGLDAESGIDEPIDAELNAQSLADEGKSLLEGSEAAGELSGDDADEIDEGEGGEYGWTDESEPLEDQNMYEGSLVLEDEDSLLDDRGEEGFGDDALGGELDIAALPPLDQSDEHGLDLDATELDGEATPSSSVVPDAAPGSVRLNRDGRTKGAAPTVRSRLGVAFASIAAARVRVEVLQRSGRPLRGLTAAGATGLAWDGSLLVAEPGDAKPQRRYAGPDALGGLAAIETLRSSARGPSGHAERTLEISLLTPEALLRSTDGGRTFAARSDWPESSPASSIAYVRKPGGGARLLAASPQGALLASDDGSTFFALDSGGGLGGASSRGPTSGVVRITSDGGSSALALVRAKDNTAVIAFTRNAAGRFDRIEAPVDAIERMQDAQVAGSALLCCRRAPEPRVLWSLDDTGFDDAAQEEGAEQDTLVARAAWYPLFAEGGTPMRILEERRGAVAYLCVPMRDQVAVVRCALPADAAGGRFKLAVPELVFELPRDVGAALQLTGAHEDGITTLHVGTERAWLRVTVLPGGDDA